MANRTVIILDGDEFVRAMIQEWFDLRKLGERFTLMFATTIQEAKRLCVEQKECLAAIGVCGLLPSGSTTGFITWLRQEAHFEGIVIAMSTSEMTRIDQIKAGCSHQIVGNDKRDVVLTIDTWAD